jgi:hypothetical protein
MPGIGGLDMGAFYDSGHTFPLSQNSLSSFFLFGLAAD